MNKLIVIIFLLCSIATFSQELVVPLDHGWTFRKTGSIHWMQASVPGTVHYDLLQNKQIPDPFWGTNEPSSYWVDSSDWEYQTIIDVSKELFDKKQIDLVFDGLDTYADVYLNKKKILSCNNMFRQWVVNARPFLRQGKNTLLIKFRSALTETNLAARAALPDRYPDNNRVFARKAAFQFGWDWGPRMVGAGIWQPVWIDAYNHSSERMRRQGMLDYANGSRKTKIELVQEPDSIGRSFYFRINGKNIFAKGANWIPASIYLPSVSASDYRRLLTMVKDANMNMLRVWGGGVYESDVFYDICDELGIMVWQDFMFANSMYPANDSMLANIRKEVNYQVKRLRHHPCIVLWCGNNEISEAWHNWGWQEQFNITGHASAKIWSEYTKLFHDSLPVWIHANDPTRPYIPGSPMHGWGRPKSYTEGDSHFWGLWWGLQGWEVVRDKTGRFVSEYGMQSMPNRGSVQQYYPPLERAQYSPAVNAHQKANDGFSKLNHYLREYFIDSSGLATLPFEDYCYLTQCLQYYVLKNVIALHRSREPYNMGSLLWQMNDCWPVTSWSITDYDRTPKAGWYAAKLAFSDEFSKAVDSIIPKQLKMLQPNIEINKISDSSLQIKSKQLAKFVYLYLPERDLYLSDNYFDLQPGETKELVLKDSKLTDELFQKIRYTSLFDVLKSVR